MSEEAAKKFSPPVVPALIGVLVVGAFFIGSLWTKVQYLEKNGVVKSAEGGSPSNNQPAQPSNPYAPVKAETLNIPAVNDKDHMRGAKDAKLTWIEYSDLECPFCKRVHPDLQKALSEYEGKIRWVYRHFPLDQIHSKADKEAEAAECAGELGGNDAFWAYVDKLFEITPSNNGLNPDELPKIAAQVGLDQAKFKSCLDDGKYAGHVEDDYQGGTKAGVTGTPGNFLLDDKGNAWIIPGAVPYSTIKQLIDNALGSKAS